MGVLKEIIKKQYEKHGARLPQHAAQVVYDELASPGKYMVPGDDLRVGGFAFMLYDLTGKTSRMEQYSPVLIVDQRQVLTKRYVWGLSMNFIPVNTRVVFFDQLLNNYEKTLKDNAKVTDVSKERVLTGVSFEAVYRLLQAIGYEYALRQFDITLINQFYNVSTNFLDMFMTFDTQRFTGVDEGKLLEIWMAKLEKQEQRHQEMMIKLYTDYDEMAKTLSNELKDSASAVKNMAKTIDTLRKIEGNT